MKTGLKLTLTRALGKTLMPQRLDWRLPDGVVPKSVMIDGQSVTFETKGNLVSFGLPALMKTMSIKLIL